MGYVDKRYSYDTDTIDFTYDLAPFENIYILVRKMV